MKTKPPIVASPLPWVRDTAVPYYLLDANGRFIADFNPPYLGSEEARPLAELNCAIAAKAGYAAEVAKALRELLGCSPRDPQSIQLRDTARKVLLAYEKT